MSFKLLPKSTEEFSDTKFWEGFFKTRGSKAFEWYGEYQDMVDLWAQYVKSGDRVLNIGCGNSELGADLHDRQSCEVLCIDTSATVVQQMTRKHCGGSRRPRLSYRVMDATKLDGLEDGGFACAVDKGTLDALMSSTGSAVAVDAMLTEVHRILRVGGRHLIVSLCQRQVVDKLMEHITLRPWIARVHQAAAVSASDPSGFPLPVFFVALTKLRPAVGGGSSLSTMVQVQDAYSTGPPDRLDSVHRLADWIRQTQLTAYTLARPGGSGDAAGGDKCTETQFAYACGRTGLAAFDCRLLTHALPSRRRSGYAVFIEPLLLGGGPATSPEQRRDLLDSQATLRRLLFVRLHPWLHYGSDADLQASLSGLVMAFAPRPGMPESEVPFLSTGQQAYPYRTLSSDGRYLVEESDTTCGELRLVCLDSDLAPLQCRAAVAMTSNKDKVTTTASGDSLARLLDQFVDEANATTSSTSLSETAFVNWPCDLDCLIQRAERGLPSLSLHRSAAASSQVLDLLADRFGLVYSDELLSATPRRRRLVALFPPADSLAAYSTALSPESLAAFADAVNSAEGRLVVASRMFDKALGANAGAVAFLRQCGRFPGGVACATFDIDGEEPVDERRRYWIACASTSVESAARAADLLAGLPGVLLMPGPSASDESGPPPG